MAGYEANAQPPMCAEQVTRSLVDKSANYAFYNLYAASFLIVSPRVGQLGELLSQSAQWMEPVRPGLGPDPEQLHQAAFVDGVVLGLLIGQPVYEGVLSTFEQVSQEIWEASKGADGPSNTKKAQCNI